MDEVVKWGIIGLGNIAHEFAKSFYNTKKAKLIAIASKSQNKLTKFKENFNIDINNCHNDYEELLKIEDPRLYKWITGMEVAPTTFQTTVLELIKEFNLSEYLNEK